MHLKEELQERGFLNQVTNEDVFEIYNSWNQTFYLGVDPTADSLHLGNFVQIMHAVQYMKRWNKLILIVWGATGMIGDPGGKDSERSFLDEETLQHNVISIEAEVQRILSNLRDISWTNFIFEVKNNLDFYRDLTYLQFLREVGKHITVNQMMSKETVKRRIEDPDKSISYTEFSYMLMQAYDFYKLYTEHSCRHQIAGSDQRWNLVTWLELIKKKCDAEVYGATWPLVLDSTGKKFGKSEWNALRMNPEKNSPFVIYQYFMNATDEDVAKYLKLFTLQAPQKIEAILDEHKKDLSKRFGQSALAYQVTRTIFGEVAAKQAWLITNALFSWENPLIHINTMTEEDLQALHKATSTTQSTVLPTRLIDALVTSGLCESNGQAKKDIANGAIFVNEEKTTDINQMIWTEHLLQNKLILLRKGKKNFKTLMV